MYVADEYSELGQELKMACLVIDPPRFFFKFQNLAPMIRVMKIIIFAIAVGFA